MEVNPEAPNHEDQSFRKWISRPQNVISLSALLLSICGLALSVYEASLIRKEQRASVWPHLEVGISMGGSDASIIARNVGVGPARVEAVGLAYDGNHKESWIDLLRSVDQQTDDIATKINLLNNRVLAPKEEETIFSIKSRDMENNTGDVNPFQIGVLTGKVELRVCYCSVYEQCWITTLQNGLPDPEMLLPNREAALVLQEYASKTEKNSEQPKLKSPRSVENCKMIRPSAI